VPVYEPRLELPAPLADAVLPLAPGFDAARTGRRVVREALAPGQRGPAQGLG
jgi:hypothetical protein